jgi:multidrug efflux system outer membrane protein
MSVRTLLSIAAGALFCVLGSHAAHAEETITLERALVIARHRAPEIAAARANVDQEVAQASAARAGYMPTLSATLTGQSSATRDQETVSPQYATVQTAVPYAATGVGALAMRWTFYDFGRTGNNVANADAQLAASQSALDATVAVAMANVANAYMTVVYDEELRRLAQVTVANRERLLTTTKGLVKTGILAPVEELRAVSRLESAKHDLSVAETAALDARSLLAGYLFVSGPFKVAMPELPKLDTDDARVRQAAADKRETLAQQRHAVEANHAAADAARSRWYPTLSFNVDASQRYQQITSATAVNDTRAVAGSLVATIPIFDWTIPTGVDNAEANAAQGEAQLADATRDAKTEASRAAIAVNGAVEEIDHSDKAAVAAAAVFAVIQARFERGLASPLDVIDAESADAAARIARASDQLTHAQSVVRLMLATGQASRLGGGRAE